MSDLLTFINGSGTFDDHETSSSEYEGCGGSGEPCLDCTKLFIKEHPFKHKLYTPEGETPLVI